MVLVVCFLTGKLKALWLSEGVFLNNPSFLCLEAQMKNDWVCCVTLWTCNAETWTGPWLLTFSGSLGYEKSFSQQSFESHVSWPSKFNGERVTWIEYSLSFVPLNCPWRAENTCFPFFLAIIYKNLGVIQMMTCPTTKQPSKILTNLGFWSQIKHLSGPSVWDVGTDRLEIKSISLQKVQATPIFYAWL